MKNLVLGTLSGAALLQVATAACCRSNACLKAIALQADVGVADCSSNLVVNVTPSAVIVTETATLVESAIETDLFTETTTAIASTETLLFTETTTVTASTATNTVTGATITVPYTTTVFATAAPVITTSYIYQMIKKARSTHLATIPEYATASCADWDRYARACKCAGVEPTTVTAEAATFTVTVPADHAITNTVGTVSSTQIATVYVTETTSITATDAATVIQIVTFTETATESSVAASVQATQTPSVVVPVSCRPTGEAWRAMISTAGGMDRWMLPFADMIVWVYYGNGAPAPGTDGAQFLAWTINNGGFLEQKYAFDGESEVLVPYLDTSAASDTVVIQLAHRSAVEAGVAAGTMEKIRACVGADDNKLRLTSRGRSNLVYCGSGFMSLSTNDPGPGCPALQPLVTLL